MAVVLCTVSAGLIFFMMVLFITFFSGNIVRDFDGRPTGALLAGANSDETSPGLCKLYAEPLLCIIETATYCCHVCCGLQNCLYTIYAINCILYCP